jgi:pyruvate/2-oxoglutarate/acetoin dehydrogenase E1 component
MPSTSWDVYGLLMTAAEFRGPVIVLEPKWMYRQTLGPAFPGEPTDEAGVAALRKSIMRGAIPEIDPTLRVPFGKLAVRRPGRDVTIVAWGRAVWTAMAAAEALAAAGVDAEVLDLRTLVPPDLDGVAESVARTGRLVVAAEDRNFAGFVRSIQGAVPQARRGDRPHRARHRRRRARAAGGQGRRDGRLVLHCAAALPRLSGLGWAARSAACLRVDTGRRSIG